MIVQRSNGPRNIEIYSQILKRQPFLSTHAHTHTMDMNALQKEKRPAPSDVSQVACRRSSQLFTVVMCFFILFSMQSMRINMSVAIVCMVNHTAVLTVKSDGDPNVYSSSKNVTVHYTYLESRNVSSVKEENNIGVDTLSTQSNKKRIATECRSAGGENNTEEEKEDGPFSWSKRDQSLVLNSYYWGLSLFSIPTGWLLNRFGNVRVLSIFTGLSAACCLLIPLVAAHYGPIGLILLRVLTGFMACAHYPGLQNILAKWLPPSKLSGMGSFVFTGAACGTIVTLFFSGYMCKYGFADGWQSIFYINGAFCLAVTLVWFLLVNEYPAYPLTDHRERKASECSRTAIPWKSIFTSKPVYAVLACTTAIDFYGTIGFLYLPTFLSDVMNFTITSNGLFSSLPYVLKMITQFSGGLLCDILINKTDLSVGTLRKLVVGTGKIVCAASIIVVGFLSCEQRSLAVVLMMSSLAGVGLMEMGYSINPIDIGGIRAGLIVAISNFISVMLAQSGTTMTTVITSENPTRESWQIVFAIAASVVLVTFVIYICLASGELQPWAKLDIEATLEIPLNSSEKGDIAGVDSSNEVMT